MPLTTRRIGAAILTAGSILLLAACASPKGTPVVPSSPATTPALTANAALISRTASLDDGSSYSGTVGSSATATTAFDAETGTYVTANLNLTVHCTPKVWNANLGAITTQVTLTNNGKTDLDHVVVVVDGVSPSTISLLNPDGVINGKAFIYFGHIDAGATTQARTYEWKSDCLKPYVCVTHVEAGATLETPVSLTCADVDNFLAGLTLTDTVRAELKADLEAILNANLTEDEKVQVCERFKLHLKDVDDVDVQIKLRDEFKACFMSAFDVDGGFSSVSDAELKELLRGHFWETLHLRSDEFESLKVLVHDQFEADLDGVTDATLKAALEAKFQAVLSFCDRLSADGFDQL